MSSVLTFHALLIDELRDLFFAEKHLLKALPKMARAATSPALKAGFTAHLAPTREHVARLAHALEILGRPGRRPARRGAARLPQALFHLLAVPFVVPPPVGVRRARIHPRPPSVRPDRLHRSILPSEP